MRKRTRTEKFLSVTAALSGCMTAVLLLGAVLAVQKASDRGSLPPDEPTTETAQVTEMTDAADLPDAALEDAVEPVGETSSYPVFLMQGDRGEAVYRLQRQLTALGYETGGLTGVYDLATARAVRRFQEDTGFVCDGVCSAAVAYAAAYLAGEGTVTAEIPQNTLCDALCRAGYLEAAEEAAPPQTVRNALILFQRTHGLCGSGEADYATLCALGIGAETGGIFPLTRTEASPDSAAGDALHDLRCRSIARALAEFLAYTPGAYDLRTLTMCAAVLCARTEDVRFPASLDAVCALGLLIKEETHGNVLRGVFRADDPLLLRAAEDALAAWEGGTRDGAYRALYVCCEGEVLPRGAVICAQGAGVLFYR